MTSHAKHAKEPKAPPLSAQQRHDKASALAFANIHKHGVEPLRNQLRHGFEHKFAAEIDAADPTLHDTDPLEYDRRVAAALREHMLELSRRSLASRAAKREAKRPPNTATDTEFGWIRVFRRQARPFLVGPPGLGYFSRRVNGLTNSRLPSRNADVG